MQQTSDRTRIDLGRASRVTKGPAGPVKDDWMGRFVPGLSKD